MSRWSLYQVPPQQGGHTVVALRKIRKPVKITHTAFAKHRVQGPNFIGEMCIPEKVIELCQWYSSAVGNAHIDEKACKKVISRADSMKPENAMTPHLDSESKPNIDMTAKQQVSHTIFTFGNVALVVAGSLNGPTAELFRTFQDVIVPERPAVRCSTQSRRQQCIQNKCHSPAEWAGCRVTDSRPPTNEPCRQTFAARGRPRLSYRELAPVRLTAAQPGPWLRPATYSPSQIDNTDQAKPPDIRHTRQTQKGQTNSGSKPTPGGGQRQRKRSRKRGPPGAPRNSRP